MTVYVCGAVTVRVVCVLWLQCVLCSDSACCLWECVLCVYCGDSACCVCIVVTVRVVCMAYGSPVQGSHGPRTVTEHAHSLALQLLPL